MRQDEPHRSATTGSALEAAGIRPERVEKSPPCAMDCVSGGDPRRWIGLVAQRRKLGSSDHEAYRQAWELLVATNPFPATLGRVCPHPCEGQCNREGKDGAVAINALERFLGDWALSNEVPLPRLAPGSTWSESIGVVGAGPAGLSFAYQMARRGYDVSVYERDEEPGGMLQFGIPEYRLPGGVLAAEVARIFDLGITLELNTAVGRDISVETLRRRHAVVFLGIGASRGRRLGIPGEDGAGAMTGTEYLAQVNRGSPVELGAHVVVVGGGNTAIDAARAARRSGAEVTLLYRRTREEMPAIDAEVEDALVEGVWIAFLAAPVKIRREGGRVRAVVVQRMTLGEPDASGRRTAVPVPGSESEVIADAVIAAVSQEPDWDGLKTAGSGVQWVEPSTSGDLGHGLWVGGDALGSGLAGLAIRQGREAAEAAHARLRGLPPPAVADRLSASGTMIKTEFFPDAARTELPRRPPADWLSAPDSEIQGTISEAEFLHEVSRCLSCGLCYGCEQCLMYCNAQGLTPVDAAAPGRYFTLDMDQCLACGKCVDLCPCGFLNAS